MLVSVLALLDDRKPESQGDVTSMPAFNLCHTQRYQIKLHVVRSGDQKLAGVEQACSRNGDGDSRSGVRNFVGSVWTLKPNLVSLLQVASFFCPRNFQ